MKKLLTSGIKWEDNLRNDHKYPVLICILRVDKKRRSEGEKGALRWEVIDSYNGIAYEVRAVSGKTNNIYSEQADDILKAHNQKYYVKGKTLEMRDVKKCYFYNEPNYYYEIVLTQEKALVYRIYKYRPLPKNEVQGVYEVIRVIFHKDKAWTEERKGERTELTPNRVFAPNSFFRKIKTPVRRRPFGLEPDINSAARLIDDIIKTAPDIQKKDHPASYISVDTPNMKWSRLNNAFSFENAAMIWRSLYYSHTSTPIAMATMFYKRQQKQKFFKDVPEDIKEYLERNGTVLAANDTAQDHLSGAFPDYLAIMYWVNSCNHELSITGQKKTWYFKYNPIIGKWSSITRRWAGTPCTDGYIGRAIERASKANDSIPEFTYSCNRKINPHIFDGTMYEGLLKGFLEEEAKNFCMVKQCFEENGILATAKDSTEFPATEQALKMGRGDLFTAVMKERNDGRSLPEVFGITGKQLKFIPTINNTETCKSLCGNIKHLKEIPQLSIETKLKLSAVYSSLIDDTLEEFSISNRSPDRFMNAVAKYSIDRQEIILSEFVDYRSIIKRIREHRPDMVFNHPEFPKPSKVREYHDRSNLLLQEILSKDDEEKLKRANCVIAEQKKEYAEMEFEDSKFALILPEDAEDIITEGRELLHCVASYVESVAQGETHILFLRKKEDIKKRFFTMEVREDKIRQFYGYHDSFNRDPDVKEFVIAYAKKMNYSIDCSIG